MSEDRSNTRRGALEAVLTSAGVGSMAGTVAGLVWGGVAGRIAMRILFLTSDDRVRGLISDDGFEIGRISGDTVVLLIGTSIMGGIVGLLYGIFRMLLGGPRWARATGVGIAVAAGAGGGLIVKADGIDFLVLDPLWLAVTLFLVIPGAWGVTVVLLTERLLRPGAVFRDLPVRINDRLLGGTLGWAMLAAITAVGIADLARDVAALT